MYDPADPAAPRDGAEIWVDDEIGGVEAMRARFVRHRFRPHTHDALMLGLIEAGTKGFERERRRHVAPPGSISVVDPGDLHTGYRLDGERLTYRALYLPPGLLAQAADGEVPSFAAGMIDDAPLFHGLMAAHRAIAGDAERLVRESLLLEAVGLLVRRHGVRRRTEPGMSAARVQIRRARALLAERLAEDLPVAALAEEVGLSVFHFMREFRRQAGMPVHAYRTQLRVERAKALLRAGRPLAEVALETGFADQSHLTRRFRERVGVPPGVYRDALRSG